EARGVFVGGRLLEVAVYVLPLGAALPFRGDDASSVESRADGDSPDRVLVVEGLRTRIDQAGPGRGVALLLLDIDHFKRINDGLGHGAGDTLLDDVTDRLRRTRRTSDLVARLGSDEFVIAA